MCISKQGQDDSTCVGGVQAKGRPAKPLSLKSHVLIAVQHCAQWLAGVALSHGRLHHRHQLVQLLLWTTAGHSRTRSSHFWEVKGSKVSIHFVPLTSQKG